MSSTHPFEVAPPEAEFCQMDWTGERMVPGRCDALTELYHWQRYLFFRPWYEGKAVVDAGSGEGYGTNYASVFAKSAIGIDVDAIAIDHARRRYPFVEFEQIDVTHFDYSNADLVTCFEVIEHLAEPAALLRALAECQGTILISTPHREFHSPGNALTDTPLNEFHTVEWTPTEFAEVVRNHFPNREIRFYSQQSEWPGLIHEGLDAAARYCIAAIMPTQGELPATPHWPKLGLSIPTFNGAANLKEAVITLSRSYPGEIDFAVVSNGCNSENLAELKDLQSSLPKSVFVLEQPFNLGYGVGANVGLEFLQSRADVEYFGVSNDDVLPADDCLCELVHAMIELESKGERPGVIGPVSNIVQGSQQVDLGPMSSYHEMIFRAEQYHRDRFNMAYKADQVRGLFMLIHPDCLTTIGGFDPAFGIGNCEDDDYNLRVRFAGFTNWVAEGAFLYHKGSQTFARMGVSYLDLIEQNAKIFCSKWGVQKHEDAFALSRIPDGLDPFISLEARREQPANYRIQINGQSIDLVQEADVITLAGWVAHMMNGKPLAARERLVEFVLNLAA